MLEETKMNKDIAKSLSHSVNDRRRHRPGMFADVEKIDDEALKTRFNEAVGDLLGYISLDLIFRWGIFIQNCEKRANSPDEPSDLAVPASLNHGRNQLDNRWYGDGDSESAIPCGFGNCFRVGARSLKGNDHDDAERHCLDPGRAPRRVDSRGRSCRAATPRRTLHFVFLDSEFPSAFTSMRLSELVST